MICKLGVMSVSLQPYDDFVTGHTSQPVQNHAWFCIDLLEVLCQLSERGHASHVRSILESPLNCCPEVLLLGMAHVKVLTSYHLLFFLIFLYGLFLSNLIYGLQTAYNLIQYEVASAVLPMALKGASANNVIYNLWHNNPDILLRGLIDAVNLDPDNISRILDACQELKV